VVTNPVCYLGVNEAQENVFRHNYQNALPVLGPDEGESTTNWARRISGFAEPGPGQRRSRVVMEFEV
jgi:hypothetical protein